MVQKITISIVLIVLFSAMSSSVFGQETIAPQLTIVSGFEGGSNYQMAMDMQRMSRATLGIAKMEAGDMVAEMENGKVVVYEAGDTAMVETIVASGDTVDFLRVRGSEGSYYNFLKIVKSNTDLAFLQYDVLLYESMKDLTRTYKKTEGIRIILPMGVEQIHIITLKKEGKGAILNFDDLKNKNVAIGSSLQGTNITAKYIKEVTKMKWHDVELPYDKALKALLAGSIDAFFYVGVAPVSNLTGMSKSMRDKIALVPLNPSNGKGDLDEAYNATTITASSYPKWIETDVPTYSVRSLLVTDIDGQTKETEANIAKLMKEVLKNKDNSKCHGNWKVVNFAKDEDLDWEYYAPTSGLLK